MEAVREFQVEAKDEYQKSIIALELELELELERIADQIEGAEEGFEQQIISANKGIEDQLRSTLGGDGYKHSGSSWKRDGVTGSNLIDGLETETFSIRAYDHFDIPNIDFSTTFNRIASIDKDNITSSDLSVDALEDIISQTMSDIAEESERIFGEGEHDVNLNDDTFAGLKMLKAEDSAHDIGHYIDSDKDGADRWDGKSSKPESKFVQQIEWTEEVVEAITKRNENATGRGSENATITVYNKIKEKHTETREVFIRPGEFGKHVGFAPEFVDAPDMDKSWKENIKFKGLGEMGDIMGQFIWYKMKEGMGYAEASKPFYDQALWDDRETWVEAPSVRGVVDMGTTIAATVVGAVVSVIATPVAGAAISAAINVTDDALFTGLDVALGEQEWDEAWINYGIQSAATFGSSMMTAGIGGGATGNIVKDGIVAQVAMNATKQVASNAISGGIRAIEYSRDGGFNYNTDTLRESLIGKGALAGYLGSAANMIAQDTLGAWNLQDGNGLTLNGYTFSTEDIGKFNSFVGNVAESAVSYGMTGEVSVNMLNIDDFAEMFGWDFMEVLAAEKDADGNATGKLLRTGNYHRGGLLELNLGKKHMFSIGSGGVDMSMLQMGNVLKGLSETSKITGFKLGGKEGNSSLNAINMLGYTDDLRNWLIGSQIFDKELGVEFGDLGKDADGFDILGQLNDENSFTIASSLLGAGLEKASQLASAFGHEGAHLRFDMGEYGAYQNAANIYEELADKYSDEIGNLDFRKNLAFGLLNHYYDDIPSEDAAHMLRMVKYEGDGMRLGVQKNGQLNVYNRNVWDSVPVIDNIKQLVRFIVRTPTALLSDDPEGIKYPITEAEAANYWNNRNEEGIGSLFTAASLGLASMATEMAGVTGANEYAVEFVKQLAIPNAPGALLDSTFSFVKTASDWSGVYSYVNSDARNYWGEIVKNTLSPNVNWIPQEEVEDYSYGTKKRAIEWLYGEALNAGSIENIFSYKHTDTGQLDKEVFDIARECNIPLSKQFSFDELNEMMAEDSRNPAKFIDQMQRNYQFITVAAYEYNLDEAEIGFLYHGGVSEVKHEKNEYTNIPYGVVYGIPGFATFNIGPVDLTSGNYETEMQLIKGHVDSNIYYHTFKGDFYHGYRDYLLENRDTFQEAWDTRESNDFQYNNMMTDIINHQWLH